MPPADEMPAGISWSAILAFIFLIATILSAGALFYQSQEQQIREQVTDELTTIALLKTGQIAAWRDDRLFDARVISSGGFFADGAYHYLQHGDGESKEKILSRFIEINASPQYYNVMLVDPQGNVRLSLDPAITMLQPSVREAVAASLASGEVQMTDFHYVPGTGHVHLDTIAPLRIRTGDTETPVGAVLLSIDPADYLYPYIQSWPVPSDTAETLLIEREGDHVLYLNTLRHQKDTALNLTIPLTREDLPAVQAVLGVTGPFTGRDYRGIEVISVLEPVRDSPWYMVAKVDTAEAYTGWRSRSGLIVILIAGSLGVAVVVAGLFWQRRQKYYYRRLYAAETARREAEEKNRLRLEVLLKLAGMESATEKELAEYVLDAACRLAESPLAFLGIISPDETVFDITAWSKSVMQDCTVAVSPIHFPIERAGIWADAVRKRQPVIVNEYEAGHPGKKGLPPGHVPIHRFVSVPVFEGERIVMVAAVANKEAGYGQTDVDNLTLLMQGVWSQLRKRNADEVLRQKTTDLEAAYEEITASEEELKANYEELARNQLALRASERRLRSFYDSGLFGVIFWTMDGKITDANDTFLAMTGYTRDDLAAGRIDWSAMTPPEHRHRDEESVAELKATGINRVPFEKEYIRKDGTRVPILIAGAMLDERRYEGVAFVLDISDLQRVRSALTAEQQRYRELFENVSVGLSRSTPGPHARILAANPADLRIFGASSLEELLATPPENLYADPEDRQKFIETLMREGSVTGQETRFRTVKGTTFWGKISSKKYTADDGSVFFDNVVEDITAQKEVMENLRISEERFRGVFDRSTAGKSLTSAPDGRLLRINPAFADMLGYTVEELQLVNWADITYPEDIPASRECVRCLLAGEKASYRMEKRYLHKTGKIVWADVSTSLLRDSAGRPLYLMTTILDITERKRVDEALRETTEYLQNLIDYANAPIITWDKDFRITRFNHAFERLTGCMSDKVLGQNVDILFPPETRDRSMTYLRQAMGGERWETVEIPVLRRDGTQRIVLWNSATLFAADGTTVIATIAQGQDITERKAAEEETRSARAFLDMVIDMSPFPMWISDNTGTVMRVNRSLCEIIRLDADQILGKYNVLRDMNLENQGVMPAVRAVFDEQKPARFSIPWKAADAGSAGFAGARDMFIEVSLFPVLNARGELTHAVCQWVDVTERKIAEDRLRETNEYLQNLLDYANAPIIVWDPQFRITRFNPAFEHLTGRSEQEVLGQHLDILFPEASRDESLSQIRKTLEGERWETVEIPIMHRTGEVRTVLWNSANVIDPAGRIVSTIAQGTDITGRKQAETQLRESENSYRVLAENLPGIVYRILLKEENRMIFFNDQLQALSGYTPEELRGGTVCSIEPYIHPGDLPGALAAVEEAVAGLSSFIVEYRFLHKDGTWRTFIERGRVMAGRDGTPQFIDGVIHDITDRKRIEEALQQSEEKYRVLFTRMIEGSALHELLYDDAGNPADYRIIDVNPAFESILGIGREAVIGKSSREAYGIAVPPYLDVYARVTTTGEPARFEVYFTPMNRHFTISVYRAGPDRFATIFEDITDRKQAEEVREQLIRELEQKNAELERFTFTVSHDLKSPLITIRGFAGMIESDAESGDTVQMRKDVQRIMTAAETMQALLADLLELSRVGKIANPSETLPFSTLAREAVDLLATPLAEKNVRVEIDRDMPEVIVDHARIREVLTNIIENAVKFMGNQEQPVIRIGMKGERENPVFFVQDNGIGINPRYLERIFNLFERLDVTRHGTGIGLPIARRIIEVHGGKIWAESEGEGMGTTVFFTLPGPAGAGVQESPGHAD